MKSYIKKEINFHSKMIDMSLNIKLAYPDESSSLSSIYLLDANYFFDESPGLLDEYLIRGAGMCHIVRTLSEENFIPPSMLIGIGYTEEQRNELTRDQADRFYKCIQEELIPFIEKNFPVSKDGKDRMLYGYSSSGHFSMYALMEDVINHQQTFGKFISIAGVYYPDLLAYQIEEKINMEKEKYPFDNRKLYMAIGADDEKEPLRDYFHAFTEKLASRNYAGLTWTSEIIDHKGHYSIPEDAFREGLRWLYLQ